MPPKILTAFSTTRADASVSASSASIVNASTPLSVIFVLTSLSASAFRPTQTTLAPACAKASAHACPIPEVAPVTSTTLPLNCFSFIVVPCKCLILTAQSQKADYYDPESLGRSSPRTLRSQSLVEPFNVGLARAQPGGDVGRQPRRTVFPQRPAISFACPDSCSYAFEHGIFDLCDRDRGRVVLRTVVDSCKWGR